MRRTAALAVVAVAACALGASAQAAAPRYIVVSGGGLAKPVLLDDWNENLMLLVSLVDATRAPARTVAPARRRYDLALFWNVAAQPAPATAAGADQHGSFYPATRTQPAVFVLQLNGRRFPRLATPQSLHILRRHGVPVRVRG